jgi:heme exporter protein D
MQWFAMGGVGMYVILASGVVIGLGGGLALLIAIAGWFFRPLRILARLGAALAIAACVLPMVVGVGASAMGRARMREAVEHAAPEHREAILAQGNAEASIPTVFGGGMSCLLLIPAGLAALVALPIPAPRRDDDED